MVFYAKWMLSIKKKNTKQLAPSGGCKSSLTLLSIVSFRCVPTPAEHEVACSESEHESEAQPEVKGHEDQHEAVREDGLEHVKRCLDKMAAARDAGAVGQSLVGRGHKIIVVSM